MISYAQVTDISSYNLKKLTILKIISNSYAIINYQDKAKNKITEHNSQTLSIAFKLATYVLFLLGLLF